MVADMGVDKVADIEVEMMAGMEVDMVADINTNIDIDMEIQFESWSQGLVNWARTFSTRSLPGFASLLILTFVKMLTDMTIIERLKIAHTYSRL